MRVERQGLVQFRDVSAGQVFDYQGSVLMRISAIMMPDSEGKLIANAVDVVSGGSRLLRDTMEVTLHENAKVILG